MIALICWKCGKSSYLELAKPKVTTKQIICKACGRKKVKTFEMKTPHQGWDKQ